MQPPTEQPEEPLFMGSNGVEYTWDEIEAWDSKCPVDGAEMDHGTWIPTLMDDYYCSDCQFTIEYPHYKPEGR